MNPALVFGLGGFVYFPLSKVSIGESREYYKDLKNDLTCKIPSEVFPIAWTILYALIVVSGYFVFLTSNEYDIYLIVLFFVNIMLNKYWSVLFFDLRKPWYAFLLMFPLIGTAIAYLVLVGILQNWKSFIPYCFYIAWLFVALMLNYNLINYSEKPVLPIVGKKMSVPPRFGRGVVYKA